MRTVRATAVACVFAIGVFFHLAALFVLWPHGEEDYLLEFAALQLRDPVQEADGALAREDFRLIAFNTGWGPRIPGLRCKASPGPNTFREYPYRGDLFGGGAWGLFWGAYEAMAETYNRRLVGSPHYPFKHICHFSNERGEDVVPQYIGSSFEYGSARETLAQSNVWLAAYEGRTTALTTLLLAGEPVDSVDVWGYTPLFHAVLGRRVDAVSLLLEHGANITHQDYWNFTPLAHAARVGSLRLVKMLAGRTLDEQSPVLLRSRAVALRQAARLGDPDIVRHLISLGADLDYGGDTRQPTALHEAASRGHASVVAALLDAGANPHFKTLTGWTAFNGALTRDHGEILELLVNAGNKPPEFDALGISLLRQAAGNGQRDELLVLGQCALLLGAEPSPAQIRGLQAALETGDLSRLNRICNDVAEGIE